MRGFTDEDALDVEMQRDELIATLEENRAQHRDTFEKAIQEFEQAQIKLLEELLRQRMAGKAINRNRLAQMPVPEDHTEDYDAAIAMFKADVRDTVRLSETRFQQLVLDKWEWHARWIANTESYAAGTAQY